MIKHLRSFLIFFFAARHVEIESRYNPQQSLWRIMQLNGRGQLCVRKMGGDRLIVFGAQHGYRANVLHVFDGRIEEQKGRATLRGRIGLDPGVRIGLGLICFFAFIFFPVHLGLFSGAVPYFIGPFILLGLLGFFYWIGKDDSTNIITQLERVLRNETE